MFGLWETSFYATHSSTAIAQIKQHGERWQAQTNITLPVSVLQCNLYFPSGTSMLKSMMAKWLNSVIEGLNSKYKLPRYVLILPDKDLIENLNYFQYRVTELFETCLTWVIRQLDRVFTVRREALKLSKPGAVSSVSEPRVIWVAMITRPKINSDKRMGAIWSLRLKFN